MTISWNEVGAKKDDWGAPKITKTAATLQKARQNYYAQAQKEEEERRANNRQIMTQIENEATANRITGIPTAKAGSTLIGTPGIASVAVGMAEKKEEQRQTAIIGTAARLEKAEDEYNKQKSKAQTSYNNPVQKMSATDRAAQAKAEADELRARLETLGVTEKEAKKTLKESQKGEGTWFGKTAGSAATDTASGYLGGFGGVFGVLESAAMGFKKVSDEDRKAAADTLRADATKQQYTVTQLQRQLSAAQPGSAEYKQLSKRLREAQQELQRKNSLLANVETFVSEAARETANKLQIKSAEQKQAAYEKTGNTKFGKIATDVTSAGLGMVFDAAAGLATGVTPLTSAAIRAAGSANLEAKNEGATEASAAVRGGLEFLKVSAIGRLSNVSGIAQKFSGATGSLDDIVNAAVGRLAAGASSNPAIQKGLNYLFTAIASGAGEGAEEMIEDIVDPMLDAISRLDKTQLSQFANGEFWVNALYSGLVGAVMGLAGGALDVGNIKTPESVAGNTESITETPETVSQSKAQPTGNVQIPTEAKTAQRGEIQAKADEFNALVREYSNRLETAKNEGYDAAELKWLQDTEAELTRRRAELDELQKNKTTPEVGAENDTLLLPEVTENAIKNGLPLRKDGAVYKIVEIPQTKIDEISAYVDTMTSADTRKKFKQIIKDLFMGNTYTNANTVAKNLAYQIKVGSKGLGEIIARQPVNSELLAMLEQLDEVVENAKYMASEPTSRPERRGIERTDIFHTDVMLGKNPAVAKMRVNVGKDGNNLYFMTNEKTDSNIRQPQAGESRQSGIGEVPSANVNVSQRSGEVNGEEATTMPAKAQKYLERAENYLVRKLADTLSVPQFAQRDYLKPITQEIANEYMQTGHVSQESIDALFERAYSEGIKVDTEFYDTYKDIKYHLRTQPVTLSEQDKADIADWNDWRKRAMGSLHIVNSGGLPVDTAYQELQGMAPALFPENITHPADQLVRMLEVSKSIQKTERTLDEYYGKDAEEFRKWAKNDFTANINNMLGEFATVKRYTEERAAKADEQATISVDEAKTAYKGMKDARRELDKVKARNLLTQHDEIQLGRLLRGEMELQYLNARNENVKGITEVFEAQKEYEKFATEIKKFNHQRKEQLREQAQGYLETANDWKDKKAGISYSVNTMERNIRDIVKDTKLADSVIEEYFKPVHDAQAEATRTKNEYRDKVRKLDLSRKVAEGNQISEAAAVQLIGEAEDNIKVLEESRGKVETRDGKTLEDWRGIVADVWKNNPGLDKAKIDNAIEQFHAIYDELFERMNDARISNGYEPVDYRRGYFPHFQSGADSKLAQFGKALGIDVEVNALPTTINGLTHTFKPGIRWFGNAQKRKGVNTTYDAVEGFDRYIEGVADVIHQTENIQKLRSLATEIRYRTGDEGIKKQIDDVKAKTDIDDDQKHELIKEITEKGQFALSNFVVELDEYTNLLANKKSRHDRDFESDLGRRLYTVMKNVENRVAANMVAVNPSSWLTNFIPLTQGWATLDTKNLLNGMWNTLKAYNIDDGIVSKSSFLTNRRGSDPIVRTWAQNASAVASKPMEIIDQFTADSLVRARYKQNIEKGMSESGAMSEADAWAAGVMADRSKGALPTVFSRMNPITKLFTQFQVEVNNQLGYLFKDIPREAKENGLKMLTMALVKFMVGAFIYNEAYEYIIGRRPALDPVGIIAGGVEDLLDEELNGWEVAEGITTEVLENLPFVGGVLGGGRVPMSSALPNIENLSKAAFNEDWSSEKRWKTAAKELAAPATYLAPPFGGGQLKKIVQGITALVKGGSYSTDSQGRDILQYPVFNDTTGEKIKSGVGAVVFGKSSLKTGREWVESGFKSLGANETEVYQQMTEAGVPDTEAWEIIQTFRNTQKTEDASANEQKRRALLESDISGEGKAIIYYGLLASDKEQRVIDTLSESGADIGEVTNTLIEIKNAEDSNSKRYYIAEATLTDEEKQEIYTALISDTHGDDIYRILSSGLSFNDYLFIQNEYTDINNRNLSAANKTLAFERWIDSEGFNKRQEQAIQNSFKFYSMTVADTEGKYDELTELGIGSDTAEQIIKKASIYDTTTTAEKVKFYREIINLVKGSSQQLKALTPYLSEGDLNRCTYATNAGISTAEWVTFKEEMLGRSTQAQTKAVLDSMVYLTNKERAVLWQMQDKSWKPSKNPYDYAAGKAAYDYMHEED